MLAEEDYETFSLGYSRKVFAGLTRQLEGQRVPSILFTKGGKPWLAAMMASGCDAVGLDSMTDPREARRLAGGRIALQGNPDPPDLFFPENALPARALKVLDSL